MKYVVLHGDGLISGPRKELGGKTALQAAAMANLGAVPGGEQAIQVPGANPGGGSRRLDLAGRLPDGRAVQAVVVLAARGTRVYQATAFGPSLAPQDVETFVASVRLGAAAGAP